MSEPSTWPLSSKAIRIRMADSVISELERNDISADCYPTSLGYYPVALKHNMRREENDDFIIIYCAQGSGSLNTDQFQGKLNQGDVVVIPPNTPHEYFADDENPWTLFWCHFKGNNAKLFYKHISANVASPVIKSGNDVNLLSSFNHLIDAAHSSYTHSGFIHVSCLLKQILTLVERIRHDGSKAKAGIKLSEVQRYMRENIHRQLDLEEVASLTQLSKFHFIRKFRDITGVSPMKFFQNLKMEQACFLLEQEALSISNVAYELGYNDPLYFSRVFKKAYGMSPSQFRCN
mgnify:CR=1 FL=1